MATATESYVNTRADVVRAETLPRIKRSVTIQTRWMIGLLMGLATALLAINVQIVLAVANP